MELSKILNTDEAAVFGAAYKAAILSAGFKVKKVLTKDVILFPIQVSLLLVWFVILHEFGFLLVQIFYY